MKRFLTIILSAFLTLRSCVPAPAQVAVDVDLNKITGQKLSTRVDFTPTVGYRVAPDGSLVVGIADSCTTTNGTNRINLMPGDYKVVAAGIQRDLPIIRVPTNAGPHLLSALITNLTATSSFAIPEYLRRTGDNMTGPLTLGPMTTTARDALTPVAGMQIYNTTTAQGEIYQGGVWVAMGSSGAPGSGTVTSVAVATANGVSGTVANSTTAAVITLVLGAITPTSVNGISSTKIGYLTDVTSAIQAQLNLKQAASANLSSWSAIAPAAKADASHTHAESEVTGLVSDLAGKQPLATVLTQLSSLAGTNNTFVFYGDSRLSDSRAPSGSASGDLTGSYPGPTLAAIITAGTATKVTYDAKGRVTSTNTLNASDIPTLTLSKLSDAGTAAALNVPASGNAASGEVVKGSDTRLSDSRAPSGSASGDLTGSYPGPTLAAIITAGTATKVTYDAKGRVTSTNTLSASDIPTLTLSKISDAGTAAALNVPASGNAASGEVVKGSDTRLSDSRAPSGSASGDLTGSYPGPTLAGIITAGTATKVTYDAKGRVTSTNSLVAADIPTLTLSKISDASDLTNAITHKVNNALVPQALRITNSASVSWGTNANGDVYATSSGGGSIATFIYTNGTGTFTNSGYTTIEVIAFGGGGGGASGASGASGTLRQGGTGGGGSVVARKKFLAADLTGTVTWTVGAGGAGGGAVTATTGNAGTVGGTSTFGTYLSAFGGGGGSGGATGSARSGGGGGGVGAAGGNGGGGTASGGFPGSTGGAGSSGGGGNSPASNNPGGAAEFGGAGGGGMDSTGGVSPGGTSIYGGGGGGSGGGVTSAGGNNPPSAGGASGTYSSAGGGGGTAGTTANTPVAGGVGANGANTTKGGGGGGGGGACLDGSTNGAAGGGGGFPGGAGGGGGSTYSASFASGAGGLGGYGVIIVICQ